MDQKISGPLGLNYITIYNDVLNGQILSGLCLFCCWAVCLIYLLGHTADVYFSPSLAAICDKLKLSYDIAGVTFLAFGNGAPDVFSSIAAIFSDGDTSVLVGLGLLLGASMFILTIVVGSVTAANKAEAAPLAYVRDIAFHLLATSCLVYCAVRKAVTLLNALTFLGLYVLYVFVAVLLDRYNKSLLAKKPALSLHQVDAATKGPIEDFPDAEPSQSNDETPNSGAADDETSNSEQQQTTIVLPTGQQQPSASGGPEVLSQVSPSPGVAQSSEDGQQPSASGGPEVLSPVSPSTHVAQLQSSESEDGAVWPTGQPLHTDDLNTNMLGAAPEDGSAGLLPAPGLLNLQDPRQAQGMTNEGAAPEDASAGPPPAPAKQQFQGSSVSAFWHSSRDLLELADQTNRSHVTSESTSRDTLAQGDALTQVLEDAGSNKKFDLKIFSEYFKPAEEASTILKEPLLVPSDERFDAHFWSSRSYQRWKWRRQLKRALDLRAGSDNDAEAFANKTFLGKVLTLLLWPVVLARNLTIPVAEQEAWSRFYASWQPLLCLLFLGFTAGILNVTVLGYIPLWVVFVIVGTPASIAVRLKTYRSKSPNGTFYTVISLSSSFVLCIAWIYVIAAETVAVFEIIGHVTGVPTNILALTFLAWGNSIGDWMTNLSVAKAGYANMALAGCYGGPLFNLLMGLGIPLVWQCIIQYPQPILFSLDRTTVTTIIFLYISFVLSSAFMLISKFKYTSLMGVALLSLYIAYTVCSIILLAMDEA